jgi:hypothetical protein
MTPGKQSLTVHPAAVEWVAADAKAAAEMLTTLQALIDARRLAVARGQAVDPDAPVVVLVDEASHLLATVDRDGEPARNARVLWRDLVNAARTDYPATTDDAPVKLWQMPRPPLDSADADPAAPVTDAGPRP